MPYCLATFSAVMPSGIVHSLRMRGFVKRQPTVESAIGGTSRFHGEPDFSCTYGARVMLSTPPATKASPSPALIACAALAIACSPDPHSRFTVWPGTSIGSPASSTAIRATLRLSSPAWLVHPRITSSICNGVEVCAVHGGADRQRGKVVGTDAGEHASGAADRCTDRGNDKSVFHMDVVILTPNFQLPTPKADRRSASTSS